MESIPFMSATLLKNSFASDFMINATTGFLRDGSAASEG